MEDVWWRRPIDPRPPTMVRVLVAMLLVLVIPACSNAAPGAGPQTTLEIRSDRPSVYRVAPDGTEGGNGSPTAPFDSLRKGLEALHPGDTLVVAAGRYEEQLRDVKIRPGRRDAPITVTAAKGERVVVAGLLWLKNPSWWTIDGINVTWSDGNRKNDHMVKLTDGEGWTFSNAELWNAHSFAAILVAGTPVDFTLRGLYVHDTHESNGRNQDHLIYLNSGEGGGVVERCLLVGSPNGRAIKIGPADARGDRVGQVIIRYNTMIDNLGPSNVQLAWSSSDNIIERNLMVGAADRRANVTTFELNGSGNVVRDNVGWRSIGVFDEAGLDGNGNLHIDPRLGDDHRPQNPEAMAFGHLAPTRGP